MRNAPSPYSPPTPMPALMTSANTRTPLAVWRRSRDPVTCWVNRFSTAVTLASISWADRAEDTPGRIKMLTRPRQTAHAMLLWMCRHLIAVASSTVASLSIIARINPRPVSVAGEVPFRVLNYHPFLGFGAGGRWPLQVGSPRPRFLCPRQGAGGRRPNLFRTRDSLMPLRLRFPWIHGQSLPDGVRAGRRTISPEQRAAFVR